MTWMRLELRLLRRDLGYLLLLGTALVGFALLAGDAASSFRAPVLWLFLGVVLHGVLRWRQVVRQVESLAVPSPTAAVPLQAAHLGVWLATCAILALPFAFFLSASGSGSVVAYASMLLLVACLGGCLSEVFRVAGRGSRIALLGEMFGAFLLYFGVVLVWMVGPWSRAGAEDPLAFLPAPYLLPAFVLVLAGLLGGLLFGASRREHRPRPTPKAVRASPWHVPPGLSRGTDPLGRGARAREGALSPRTTLYALFQGLLANKVQSDEAPRSARVAGGLLFVMYLWLFLMVLPRTFDLRASILDAGVVAVLGVALGAYGFVKGITALQGMRAIQGLPVPAGRLRWILLPGPVLTLLASVVVLLVVPRLGLLRPRDVETVAVRAPGGLGTDLAAPRDLYVVAERLSGRPRAMPLPQRRPWPWEWRRPAADVWPLRWNFEPQEGEMIDELLGKPDRERDAPPIRIHDERTYFGEAVALYLRSRFGIHRDPADLAQRLGDGYDLDQVLAVGPPGSASPTAIGFKVELPTPLYPWRKAVKRRVLPEGEVEVIRTRGWERVPELDALRARWLAEKKDGRVYLFAPALREIEAEVQTDIRLASLKLRVLALLVVAASFLLGLRAGIAPMPGRLLILSVALLLPATFAFVRWEPVGVELIAWLGRSVWTWAATFGAAVLLLLGLAREFRCAWRRRLVEPAPEA